MNLNNVLRGIKTTLAATIALTIFSLSHLHGAENPVPSITINGTGGLLSLFRNDTVTLDVSLYPGSHAGSNADWWLAASTPAGLLFYCAGQWETEERPAHRGPLFSLSDYRVLSLPAALLSPGRYTLYFGVDLQMDGEITWTSLSYDTCILIASAGDSSADLIMPPDLTYLGAFRLPDGTPDMSWEYSGTAMAYYPDGDPTGPDDGFPGSIFGTGHDVYQRVSEISIPVPVISPSKNPGELNTATTLQEFHDIRGDIFGDLEIPRAGLAWLPKQGAQTSDKLYLCWGQHMQFEKVPSHLWCDLDLSDPHVAGPWYIDDLDNYLTCDYLFPIPQSWADAHLPGRLLATGRFRDGGQGSQGPCIVAIAPWLEGNPPGVNHHLAATPLLRYSSSYWEDPTDYKMYGYHDSDEWSGGAWLTTASGKSSVIFAGTKGRGDCWYGNPDGPCLECDNRGWWSTRFEGLIVFYNPADLAAVAAGAMQPHEPQPYAEMQIDEYLYHITSEQQYSHVGAVDYDPARGILYLFEPLADGDKSLVHVWKVG